MTAKEYLNQIRSYSTLIKAKEYQLEELKAGQLYMGAINYDKERVKSSTAAESSYIRQSQKIVDLELEIKHMMENYAIDKNRIIEEIGSLGNPLYTDILMQKYVYYDSFKTISKNMGYAYNYIINTHADALELFENKIFGGK